MADEATRPLERWCPVPTGNVLQTPSISRHVNLRGERGKSTTVAIPAPGIQDGVYCSNPWPPQQCNSPLF